jgi:glucose-6-phosphate-specific signal transduction histidine kinase
MTLFTGWIITGTFGGPYLSVLVVVFFIIRKFRPYVVSYPKLAVLLVPIALYLFLIHMVHDRQGFNWGYANLIMVVPAILALYLATRSPGAYWIGVALTLIATIVAWLLVPEQGLTRLF